MGTHYIGYPNHDLVNVILVNCSDYLAKVSKLVFERSLQKFKGKNGTPWFSSRLQNSRFFSYKGVKRRKRGFACTKREREPHTPAGCVR